MNPIAWSIGRAASVFVIGISALTFACGGENPSSKSGTESTAASSTQGKDANGAVAPTPVCNCPANDSSCVCEAQDAAVPPPGTVCSCPANDSTCVCEPPDAAIPPPGTICNCPDNEPNCACEASDAAVPPPPPGCNSPAGDVNCGEGLDGSVPPPGCNCPDNDLNCVCVVDASAVTLPN